MNAQVLVFEVRWRCQPCVCCPFLRRAQNWTVQVTPPVSVRDLVSVHDDSAEPSREQPARSRGRKTGMNHWRVGDGFADGADHNHLLVRRRRVSASDPARRRTAEEDWGRVETRRERLLELLREMKDTDGSGRQW